MDFRLNRLSQAPPEASHVALSECVATHAMAKGEMPAIVETRETTRKKHSQQCLRESSKVTFWHDGCLNYKGRKLMFARFPIMSRRRRQQLCWAVAVLSLMVWLVLAAAEAWTPLHAWLHGGAIPKDDDCAVMLVATGRVDLSLAAVVVVPVLVAVVALLEVFVSPSVPKLPLPPSRGPPFFCFFPPLVVCRSVGFKGVC